MPTIDDKVVAMSFEHGKFEEGVGKVLAGLDKLKTALNLKGAGKGLEDINTAGQKVDLSHISKTLDDIKSKFSALSVAALAALATIAVRAVQTGLALVKSLTIDPIKQGFQEYETGLNSIQTVLSNTAAAGTTLKDVNAALAQLNTYADKTIYNFGQMTRNIGTFTAAGIDLDTATSAIKGISNLAALSGSNAEQASTAMYQLSQALSAGRVTLMDWNSVVNAGMGGTVFQRALAQTAQHMGVLSDGAVKLSGKMKTVTIDGKSFRQSLSSTGAPGEESWLTSDVLTRTLEQLSGDLSNAKLAAQGYTKEQIKAIQTQARMALDAATQVKTLSQLLDTTKEAVGSGWAKTWQLVFGDFGEAKTLFTGLSNAIGGFVGRSANARNAILKDWKDLGGRTLLISSLKNAFKALGEILAPIKDAFRDIFPRKTGQDLFDLTKRFHEFTESLKPSPETVENLRRTFRGLFALLDIGKEIISGVFTVFGHLFGALGGGSGGFLNLTGSIGDFIVSIRNALKKGDAIEKFFDGLGTILAKPVELISALAAALGNLFGSKTTGAIGGFNTGIETAESAVGNLYDIWLKFIASLTGSDGAWNGVSDNIANFFGGLGEGIAKAVRGINWSTVLAIVNTGLFAGLVLLFKNFFGKGSFISQLGSLEGGPFSNILSSFKSISGAFSGLEGAAKGLQQNIKAKTLKEIAIAIALLVASLFVLSMIEPKKLQSAMTAMIVAFGMLIGAMALLDIVTKSSGFIRLPFIAAGLIALAAAMLVLSAAVKILSTLSWEELAKGLGAMAVLLGGITLVAGPLGKSSAGLIRAGVGIAAIGVAMKILASAIKDFGALSWTTLGKGMLSVAAALVIIGSSARLFPPNMIAIGAGLVIVATALKLIAEAVAKFGSMSLTTLGKGLGSVAVALLAIAGAMQLMPKGMILQAVGLIAIGVALNLIAKAVASMGGMSIGEIARGLATLAGSLIILAGGLIAMQGTLGGAAALTVAATGIAILAPAIKTLGGMSWGQIIKGLVSLGAALALLGGASLLLTPAIPAMLGFGAALVLIGGGLALAGGGIALIGIGLSAIAVAGPAAVAILVGALTSLMEKIPVFVRDVVKGLLELVKGLADAAPEFVASIVKILGSIATAIIKGMPEVVKAFDAIIQGILKAISDNAPAIIAAGLGLLLDLLTGIKNNVSKLVGVVVEIITTFLGALAGNVSKIVAAGLGLIVSIVKGIVSGISKVVTAGADIIVKFVTGLGQNAAKIVTAAGTVVTKFITAIGSNAIKIVTAGADVIIKFVEGLGRNAVKIVTKGADVMIAFAGALSKNAVRVADAGAQAIIDFLNGIADVIEQRTPELMDAGFNIGVAIIKGLINGLTSWAQKAYDKATNIANKIKHLLTHPWEIFSPSHVTYSLGVNIIQGLINGLDNTAPGAYKSAENLSKSIISSIERIFEIDSPSKVMERLGHWVGIGFVNGLTGSIEGVDTAFATLNEKLVTVIKTSQATIAEHKKELKKLQEADKKDTDAITAAQKAITDNQALLDLARAAHVELVKGLTKEKQELLDLAKGFDDVSKKLEEAKNVLIAARDARDQAIASFSDQFAVTPAIDLGTAEEAVVDPLGTYLQNLANQATAVATYADTLEQLRKLGLSDRTYKKLLEEGTADQQFASQLLSGGKGAVVELNRLDGLLETASKALGKNAGINLYQAGVDAAQGLIDGLISKKEAIAHEMSVLAAAIVAAIKKKLGIKSPSEVFKEVGTFAIQGLAKGLETSSKLVTNAAENIGSAAVNAMKKSMSDLSTALTSEIDSQPTITPVLDLSRVQQDARTMADILNKIPITADASYRQASTISTEQTAAEIDKIAMPAMTSFNFEQNNYSPESLSAIEIYRRTRNQLAQAQLATA